MGSGNWLNHIWVMVLFDVERAARESGLSEKEVKKIKKMARKEFPRDRMMCELHLVRAVFGN